jgi:hypothetical protein
MKKENIISLTKIVFLVALGLILKSLSGNEDANLCWLPLAKAIAIYEY